MLVSGLGLLSQTLDTKLRGADAIKQRAASLVACQFAVARARIEDPNVAAALIELQAGRPLLADLRAQIDALAEELDEQYFVLKEAAEAGRSDARLWREVFAKARAVTAVSDAGGEDPYKAAGDSIYETAFAIQEGERNELFALVEAALG